MSARPEGEEAEARQVPAIFLSYSTLDERFATWLADSLRANGLRVWFSVWEIDAGTSFVKAIEAGVSQADYLVVVLSEHSMSSPWVRRELEMATLIELERGRDDFIMPARVDGCVAPLGLRMRQHADFRLGREAGLAQLLRGLSQRVPGKVDPWVARFQVACRRDYETWKAGTFLRGYADVVVHPNNIFIAPEEQDLISGRERFERYNVSQAVEEYPSLLLLGDAGVGKTTALRELSLRYLSLSLQGHRLLPLFVPITTYEGGDGPRIVERLLQDAFRRLDDSWNFGPETIAQLFEDHDFMVLFDGLNEIPADRVPAYCDALRHFVHKRATHQGSRVIITSRLDNISRHKQSVRRISPNIFEVQKLTNDARIESFIEKYLPSPEVREAFINNLHATPTAHQMAETPLLLAAMTLVYEANGALPDTRSALLTELIAVLLGEREADTLALDRELRHLLLAHLAFTLRASGLGLGTTEERTIEILDEGLAALRRAGSPAAHVAGASDAPILLEDCIRRRLLARMYPGVRFWLEVVQEYFAARAIVSDIMCAHGQAAQGLGGSDAAVRLHRLAANEDWHQVLAIATGLVPTEPRARFIAAVRTRQPVLAAACVAGSADPIWEPLAAELSNRVVRLFQITTVLALVAIGLSAAILYPFFFWALPWMTRVFRQVVVGARESYGLGVLAYVGMLIVLFYGGNRLPALWFDLIASMQARVLEHALPDRYVQPLLRALVILRAGRMLSVLESVASQPRRQLPARLRAYVVRANAVWRFREESIERLRAWLQDEAMADYAIDRLSQLGKPEVARWLLEVVWRLPPSSATLAVAAVGRIVRERNPVETEWLIPGLRAVLDARVALDHRTRLAAYRVLLDLSGPGADIRRPRVWCALRTMLNADSD